jgi:hypothetical protein
MMQSQNCLAEDPADDVFRYCEAVGIEGLYVSQHWEQQTGEVGAIGTFREEQHLWCE